MKRVKLPKSQYKKPGPKREFSEEMLRQTEELARLGATNKQIALFFNVDETCIAYWNKNYPVFREAAKRGGMEADMKVVNSLFKKAVGYSAEEREYAARTDDEGTRQMVLIRKTIKHFQPDTTAAIFWLKNRQRDFWADVQHMDHRHAGTIEHIHQAIEDIPVQDLTEQEQKLLFKITRKQLTNGSRSN